MMVEERERERERCSDERDGRDRRGKGFVVVLEESA